MFEQPDYFNILQEIIAPDALVLLTKIEIYLSDINYDGHMDGIDSITNNDTDKDTGTLREATIDAYRDTVEYVMGVQGITLVDHLDMPLYVVERLLYAVTELGTRLAEDLPDGTDVEHDNELEALFWRIAELTGLGEEELYKYISTVNPIAVNAIMQGLEYEQVVQEINGASKARYLDRVDKPNRVGAVADYIRSIGSFGYPMAQVGETLAPAMIGDNTDAVIANEFYGLAMGSGSATAVLEQEVYILTEYVIDDVGMLLRVNAILRKLVWE